MNEASRFRLKPGLQYVRWVLSGLGRCGASGTGCCEAAKRTRDYIMCDISCGAAGWYKAYFFVFRILDSTFGVSYSSFPPFFPA